MGWSISIARAELNKIFTEAKRSYRITLTRSAHVGVVIEFDAKTADSALPVRFQHRISELFPDFVYIDFVPVPVSSEVSDEMHWDLKVGK